MDFLLAILPISFLIYVMTKKKSWPSHISLPFAAVLVYLLVLVHSRLEPNLVNATVVNGTLSALTPISIIWGAILLSLTMRRSGAERIIGEWLREVSANWFRRGASNDSHADHERDAGHIWRGWHADVVWLQPGAVEPIRDSVGELEERACAHCSCAVCANHRLTFRGGVGGDSPKPALHLS